MIIRDGQVPLSQSKSGVYPREDGLLNSTFDLLQEIKLSACVIFVANLRSRN
jgi:hypothetical protein